MGRVLFGLLLSIAAAGCIHQTPVSKLKQPADVMVVLLRDHVHDRKASPVPDVMKKEISEVLHARNLKPEFPDSSLFEAIGKIRDTGSRLRFIAGNSKKSSSQLLLLVETKVSFYSQLSGRYRWTVAASISIATRGDLTKDHRDQFQIPAVLTYAHEKENEALSMASSEISRRLGILLDDFLAGAESFSSKNSIPIPSPDPGGKMHGIYFVLLDRFANGDRSNDGKVDLNDAEAWHGGDLKGLISHLDYIRKMGFDTIWVSPVFLSQKEKFMGHGAFHGYWTLDPTRIDPRFGTRSLLRKLTQKAHARGMKIVLDLVLNHVGYKSRLPSEHPDWFHHNGTIKNWQDHEQILNNEVHGLPDLAQENPEVYSWLLSAARAWLQQMDIDGFRLDAVKHVPLAFWRKFNSALESVRPGVILLGEHYDGDPAKVDLVQRQGHFSNMFDFPIAFALKDVFCSGKASGKLAAVLSNDRLYTHPEDLVTFLDNHDIARIRTACGGDLDKVKEALIAEFAIRGIPAVTYGTEVGLCGAGEPENRADMVFPEQKSLAVLGEHIRTLFALRRDNPALDRGRTRILSYDDGLLVFLRLLGGSAVLVAINTRSKASSCSLPMEEADGEDLLNGKKVGKTFEIAPGQTRLIALRVRKASVLQKLLASAGPRKIRVFVKTGCVTKDSSLSLVGSGPELGMWNPDKAIGPLTPSEKGFTASFSLPTDLVFSFKFVIRSADGKIHWEKGDDRYLFVRPGDGPLTLNLTWREC